MKKLIIIIFALIVSGVALAQQNADPQPDIQTIFKSSRTTGYGAITNKFTSIRGEYANMVGVYGGVFIDRRVMIGVGGFATTNNITVPAEFSSRPGVPMSYGFVQTGLMTEYVVGSNKPVHLVLSMFAGAGFSFQYENWTSPDYDWNQSHGIYDQQWFFVLEPGAQLEINMFKWMRLSPGISYRGAFNSDGLGLSDSNMSDISYNVTLKFGKF